MGSCQRSESQTVNAVGIAEENAVPMTLGHDPADEPDIQGDIDERPVGAIHDPVPGARISKPCFELLHITGLFLKKPVKVKAAFKKTGEVSADIGIFADDSSGVGQPRIAEVAHDDPHVRIAGGGLVDRERVAVSEKSAGAGSGAGVNGDRTAVSACKLKKRGVHRIADISMGISDIEFKADASAAFQLFLGEEKGLLCFVGSELIRIDARAPAQKGREIAAVFRELSVSHHDRMDDLVFRKDLL